MALVNPRFIAAVLACSMTFALAPACATHTSPVSAPPRPAPASPAPAPTGAAPAAVPRPPAPAPLVGHVTREELRAYVPWQRLFVDAYVPDPATAAAIRADAGSVTVLLVMATWCPDSKREVPRFFAIMDAAGIRETQLTMIGVDRTKKDAEGLTEKWGITRVPTFVFFRNGQEIGRVVEKTPAGATLEGEIARVMSATR